VLEPTADPESPAALGVAPASDEEEGAEEAEEAEGADGADGTDDSEEEEEEVGATVGAKPAPTPDNLIQFFKPEALPYAVMVLLAAIVLVRLSRRLAERVAERTVRRRLVVKQAHTILAFVVYAVAMIVAARSLFSLSPEALFALSGTIAVTLGFAFKDVAASFLAGISILLNKPFQVGDRIAFAGYYGEVVEIGLRSVRLVTLDDNQVTVPSNLFLTSAVASANAGALDCMVVVDFHVVPDADHRAARQVVYDAVIGSKYLYLGKPLTVLVAPQLSTTGRASVRLTAKAYVYDARHERAFASDVTDRVLLAFRERGITMPS